MKEIKYYRTYSYKPNNQLERRDFENAELAIVNAINDLSNTNFNLYEIKMIFDGVVTETKKYLCPITCGKDIQKFKQEEKPKKI